MLLITGAQGKGGGVRKVALAAACGIILCLGACSDEKGHEAPAGKEVLPQSVPAPAPDSPQQAALPALAPATSEGGACVSLLTVKCKECHSAERICEKLGKKSKSRWKRTVARMVERGAKVSADESTTVLECLDSGTTNLQPFCQ